LVQKMYSSLKDKSTGKIQCLNTIRVDQLTQANGTT
jgi:hypothetical protein